MLVRYSMIKDAPTATLKPQNIILIDKRLTIRLADCGLATHVEYKTPCSDDCITLCGAPSGWDPDAQPAQAMMLVVPQMPRQRFSLAGLLANIATPLTSALPVRSCTFASADSRHYPASFTRKKTLSPYSSRSKWVGSTICLHAGTSWMTLCWILSNRCL